VSRTATMATERAKGLAAERGILKPNGNDGTKSSATAAPLIGVMDVPAGLDDTTPVMPLADGPISDPSSIEREPFGTPDGGLIGGVAAVDEATVGNEGIAAGEDGDRGTWHRG
jgi:hypothetical protein